MDRLRFHDIQGALDEAGDSALSIHYRLWGKTGTVLGLPTLKDSFSKLADNMSFLTDLLEVLEWADGEIHISGTVPKLPFACSLELHAHYSNSDIKAALDLANLESAGPMGVGVLHCRNIKTYALLITFQKTEREFSPTTMYADYPISRDLLHWESQSNTTQNSVTGQNLIHHMERGYTILIFVRAAKKRNGIATPFIYLGPAARVSFESERPIKMVWRLYNPMPADIFEENRRGG